MSRSVTECAMAELPVPPAGDKFIVLIANQPDYKTPGCDLSTTSLQASAAVEDTRLIPLRPTTPFAAYTPSGEFIEEGDEETSSSTPPLITLVSQRVSYQGDSESQKRSMAVRILYSYLRYNTVI